MSAKSPYKKGGKFQDADPLLFELAKNLRRNMTGTEIILWQHLKSGINGFEIPKTASDWNLHCRLLLSQSEINY